MRLQHCACRKNGSAEHEDSGGKKEQQTPWLQRDKYLRLKKAIKKAACYEHGAAELAVQWKATNEKVCGKSPRSRQGTGKRYQRSGFDASGTTDHC